jgi:Protein of unknown function (DUF3667)
MELQLENTCQNCNRDITDNFCSSCGQKKYKRIDKKYITDELQYTVWHLNKGLFYSIKKIIQNPGKTAQEFINGNRVNHYKPISLMFVLCGFSGFLALKLLDLNALMKQYYAGDKVMNTGFMNNLMTFNSNYNSFIMLATIPIIALFTKFAFRKWGHNYYEHIVINAYGYCVYLIFNIFILVPLMYLLKSNVILIYRLTMISMALIPIYMVWFFKGFYPNRKLSTIILRVLMIVGLIFFCFVILIFAGVILYAMLNPEGMKALAPKQ